MWIWSMNTMLRQSDLSARLSSLQDEATATKYRFSVLAVRIERFEASISAINAQLVELSAQCRAGLNEEIRNTTEMVTDLRSQLDTALDGLADLRKQVSSSTSSSRVATKAPEESARNGHQVVIPQESAHIGMTVIFYVDQNDLPESPFLGRGLFSKDDTGALCDSQTASTVPVHLQFILATRLSHEETGDMNARLSHEIKACRDATGLDFQLVSVPANASFVQAVNLASAKSLGEHVLLFSAHAAVHERLLKPDWLGWIFRNWIVPVYERLEACTHCWAMTPLLTEHGVIVSAGLHYRRFHSIDGQYWAPMRRLQGRPERVARAQSIATVDVPSTDFVAWTTHSVQDAGGLSDQFASSPQLAFADLAMRVKQGSPEASVECFAGIVVPLRGSSDANYMDYIDDFTNEWYRELNRSIGSSDPLLTHLSVAWDLYCGCTGFNIEVINYAVSLEPYVNLRLVAGDSCFCGGWPTDVEQALERMRVIPGQSIPDVDVWISHKPPDRYPRFPYNGLVKHAGRPRVVIGRSMSESDMIPDSWVMAAERVDEIWVPTQFHVDVFAGAGIPREKLFKLPLSLDKYVWDPESAEPMKLSVKQKFKFLSVFKWEDRKGPDVLLRAYFEEFTQEDDVCLIIQTYLYMDSDPRNKQRVQNLVDGIGESLNLSWPLPCVHILTAELPTVDMVGLYSAVNAFVLPTRGEGWCLPCLEASFMGVPAIVTNWSGPAEFLKQEWSYPITVERFTESTYSDWVGQRAEPSLTDLKSKMRRLFENPQEARTTGARARAHVLANFENSVVSKQVLDRLRFHSSHT